MFGTCASYQGSSMDDVSAARYTQNVSQVMKMVLAKVLTINASNVGVCNNQVI